MAIYVQYGCGLSCPDGWISFDASPTLRLQRLPLIGRYLRRGPIVFPAGVRYGDIVKGLPLAKSSADGIYASHVLEHLAREDFTAALRNTLRVLKPGGIFRLVVPDMEARARGYIARLEQGGADANDWLMRNSNLGLEKRPRGLAGWVRTVLGNSGHLWMWDSASMRAALERAGFEDVRICRFNDSADPAFRSVEDASRFHDPETGIDECALEARKPGRREPVN